MTSIAQNYEIKSGLRVSKVLAEAARGMCNSLVGGRTVTEEQFWSTLSDAVSKYAAKNQYLLNKRDGLQTQIDSWHKDSSNKSKDGSFELAPYKSFLEEIGYLNTEEDMGEVKIVTKNVDPEISLVPAPQLVVPADNARYALNAANARWGNLFDALYGTNVVQGKTPGSKTYDPERGQKVFDYCNALLDEIVPLKSNRLYGDVAKFIVESNDASSDTNDSAAYILKCVMHDESTSALANPNQFVGFTRGDTGVLESVLLKNNGLHIILNIDNSDKIGKMHNANVKSILLEAAVSTILDFEDSVAAVDAEDKAKIYHNFAGLMKGDLSAKVRNFTRVLKNDRTFSASHSKDGSVRLKGRSLLLCRNVGIHMYTDAVQQKNEDANGWESVPEGFLDLWFTCLGGLHDLNKEGHGDCNSRCGSIYIVKPKMHGPEEVKFVTDLFTCAEIAFNMAKNTLKIGIMDEERRTTVNLKACLHHAVERVVFINTGFLDRTGDEIHTSMEAGAMLPKSQIAVATWRKAYEAWNVDVGIETKLIGKGQIGKGMWAEPDNLLGLLQTKHVHPQSGAICAWVPSPTGAVIHAIHYHTNNVLSIVKRIGAMRQRNEKNLMDILTPPLLAGSGKTLSKTMIQNEMDTAVQAILGYVSRWVGQGVGCSKVPDLNNIGKMEDRATLRISSQLLANWLHWKVCSKEEIIKAFEHWAGVVDKQNESDINYVQMKPVGGDLKASNAYMAGLELVLNGRGEANGYTENILTKWRRKQKLES